MASAVKYSYVLDGGDAMTNGMQIARRMLVVALCFAGIGRAVPGLAWDRTMSCGSGLVVVGASQSEVLSKCGEPTSRASSGQGSGRSGGSRRGARSSGSAGEVWTYDRGSSQLVRELHFKRGQLERIEVGGYGRK